MKILTVLIILGFFIVSISQVDASRSINIKKDLTYSTNEKASELELQKIQRFGVQTKKEGSLEIVHYDYEEKEPEIHYFLRDNEGERYSLYLLDDFNFEKVKKLEVEGIQFEKEIAVQHYEILNLEEEISTIGEQRILVLLAHFQDNPLTPITLKEADRRVFDESNENSVQHYIKEVSYNKAYLNGDIFGWYTLPYDQWNLSDPYTLTNAIIPLADKDVNFLEYKYILILISSGCPFAGSAMVRPATFFTNDGTVTVSVAMVKGEWNLESGVATHELLHEFGLGHAYDLECGNITIGMECLTVVSDEFDIMGSAGGKGFLNTYLMMQLGWFENQHVKEAATSGIYTLEPIETATNGLKALKIPTKSGYSYVIEFRRSIGTDTINANNLGSYVYDGAMIRADVVPESKHTYLLDMTPHYNSDGNAQYLDSQDVILKVGETFTDAINGISITTLSVTDDNLKIMLGHPSPITNVEGLDKKIRLNPIHSRGP